MRACEHTHGHSACDMCAKTKKNQSPIAHISFECQLANTHTWTLCMRYGWGVKTKTNHQNNGYIQSLFEGNPASENYESGDATLQALRVCWLYNIIFPSTCLWCVHALQPNVKPTISLLTLAISNGRGGEGLSTTERGAYTCRIFVKIFRAGFTAITILYVLPYMFPYIAAADATDTTRARCNILANLGKL